MSKIKKIFCVRSFLDLKFQKIYFAFDCKILFCALGALAGSAARFGEVLAGETSAQAWVLRVVGVLATVGVVWLVGRSARKALQDAGADAQDPEI